MCSTCHVCMLSGVFVLEQWVVDPFHVPQGFRAGDHSGFPWSASSWRTLPDYSDWRTDVMFRARLAVFDPVLVLVDMKEIGADPRLIMVTSAEIIMNEGLGVLLFTFFMRWRSKTSPFTLGRSLSRKRSVLRSLERAGASSLCWPCSCAQRRWSAF